MRQHAILILACLAIAAVMYAITRDAGLALVTLGVTLIGEGLFILTDLMHRE